MIRIIIAGYCVIYWLLLKRLYHKLKDPLEFKENVDKRYTTLYRFLKAVLFSANIKVNFIDKEKLSKKTCLIVSNHQSNWDGVIIFLLYQIIKKPKNIVIIAKKEVKKNNVFWTVVRLMDLILIDRNNLRKAIHSFEKAKNYINKENKSILIFPEGTRNKEGKLQDFKHGAFKIAYSASCPIQPILIKNSYKLSNWNLTKKYVDVQILDSIEYIKYSNMTSYQISKIIKKEMNKALSNKKNKLSDEKNILKKKDKVSKNKKK